MLLDMLLVDAYKAANPGVAFVLYWLYIQKSK